MSGTTVALLGFGALLVLIAVRAPIGLSMLLVGAAGYIHLSSASAFTNPVGMTTSAAPLNSTTTRYVVIVLLIMVVSYPHHRGTRIIVLPPPRRKRILGNFSTALHPGTLGP